VTLDLPADAPALTLPWIITIGPLRDEDDWEAVVCGPYERAHALALASAVVADEDLMAVVEPVQPHLTADQIRRDVVAARLAAQREDVETAALDAELAAYDDDPHDYPVDPDGYGDAGEPMPTDPPSIEEVRAGFARIAARLTAP
jgi:hypothetical protein